MYTNLDSVEDDWKNAWRNSQSLSIDLSSMHLNNNNNLFKIPQEIETETSKDIKVLCEVEKIWIIYQVDKDGFLEYQEIEEYVKNMTQPPLAEQEIRQIYKEIDLDGDGHIDKVEMFSFLRKLMEEHRNISFQNSSNNFVERKKTQIKFKQSMADTAFEDE